MPPHPEALSQQAPVSLLLSTVLKKLGHLAPSLVDICRQIRETTPTEKPLSCKLQLHKNNTYFLISLFFSQPWAVLFPAAHLFDLSEQTCQNSWKKEALEAQCPRSEAQLCPGAHQPFRTVDSCTQLPLPHSALILQGNSDTGIQSSFKKLKHH